MAQVLVRAVLVSVQVLVQALAMAVLAPVPAVWAQAKEVAGEVAEVEVAPRQRSNTNFDPYFGPVNTHKHRQSQFRPAKQKRQHP